MPKGGLGGVTPPGTDWIKQNLDKSQGALSLTPQNTQ
jgi:hypothetical protein